MLQLDRYVGRGRAVVDLATGASVTLATQVDAGEAPMLFASHGGRVLIDRDVHGGRCLLVWEDGLAGRLPAHVGERVAGLVDALDLAAHGRPRLVEVGTESARSARWAARLLARECRVRGWVPVALDVIREFEAAQPGRTARLLGDRSLVILAGSCLRRGDARTLARIAGTGARPHHVVRFGTAQKKRAPRAASNAAGVVREGAGELLTPSAQPSPARHDAATSHDDPVEESRRRWQMITAALEGNGEAEKAAALDLAAWLAVRGRLFEAQGLLDQLVPDAGWDGGRRGQVQDMMLRESCAGAASAFGRVGIEGRGAMIEDFVGVLEICQSVEDDQAALSRVGSFLCDRLQAASVAFVVRESGQPRAVTMVGRCTAGFDTALQAIDSGLGVPAPGACGPAESAYPVRQAADVIGAVWCRWATGMPIAAADASALLGVAATALGPSLRAVAWRHRAPAAGADAVPDLVGGSDAMASVRAAILRAAPSPFPVLIEGESGVGKELVARAIHRLGPRRGQGFEAINCAALVDDLVEAELFGHTRGAFTGAVAERPGLFESASGGTLLLDEVAELGARVQAKLLRVLQEGEVRRLGEAVVRRVDTRIVAATNRPLTGEVEAGRFRRDLRFRLDVIRIQVPPLRDRVEDVPELVETLWRQLSDRTGSRAVLSARTVAALGRHDWPGNVRELQNVLAALMVSSPRRGVIGAASLPAHLGRAVSCPEATTLGAARRLFEERYVRSALARSSGRLSPAARELGLSRQGLSKVLTRLGIAPPRPGEARQRT